MIPLNKTILTNITLGKPHNLFPCRSFSRRDAFHCVHQSLYAAYVTGDRCGAHKQLSEQKAQYFSAQKQQNQLQETVNQLQNTVKKEQTVTAGKDMAETVLETVEFSHRYD